MSTERWINEGLRVLADEGISGVRIDRIAARVGLSKGSFFHHFANATAYRAALLDAWRTRTLDQIGDAPALSDLAELTTRLDALIDVDLERSIRAWASHDESAAVALEQVDRARLAALQHAWAGRVADPDRARTAALLPHLVVIGATVTYPATTADELAAVFRLLADLIPAVPES